MTMKFEVVRKGGKKFFYNDGIHEPIDMKRPLPEDQQRDVEATLSFLDTMIR